MRRGSALDRCPRLATAAFLVALSACAAPQLRRDGYCAPPTTAPLVVPADPLPLNASVERRMAALVGLTSVLEEHPRTESSRLQAVERMAFARLAIAATAAELDCERERAEQAATTLIRAKSNETQLLTIGSIGAATATSIVGVLLSTRGASAVAQDSVAIGGGVVTAGLGLASLYVHPTVAFRHPRNMVAELWTGTDVPALYPSVVWTYLTRPEFSNHQQRSIRDHLIEHWRREGGLDDDPSLQRLVLGAGGDYDIAALRTRAQMLEEIAGEVHLESQDLASLAAALFNPTAAPESRPAR